MHRIGLTGGIGEQQRAQQVHRVRIAALRQRIQFAHGAVEVLFADGKACLVERLVATQDCYYAIGANPSASNGAGSVCLPAKTFWAETITAGTKISVVSDGTDGNLFILPAKTEGGA